MKFNIKATLLSLVVTTSVLISITIWSRSCELHKQDNNFYRKDVDPVYPEYNSETKFHHRGAQSYNQASTNHESIKYKDIECVINHDYSIQGRREGREVYLPFSFIKKYFEVYGKIESRDGYERFDWEHSYSVVHQPRSTYSPDGVFMSFENYNVEDRGRVKCVSGMEGVPLSTQWKPEGYYYPIQIAQFGLSHYSKALMEPEPDVIILEDGEEDDVSDWLVPDRKSGVSVAWDNSRHTHVLEFKTSDALKNPGVILSAEEKEDFVLSMDLYFKSNGSVTITMQAVDTQLFRIHYVLSNTLLIFDGKDIYYGIGERRRQWIHITRNISTDFLKGLAVKLSKQKRSKYKSLYAKIASISLRGQGYVDNLTLSSSAHMDQFYDAANWMVNHQDNKGGWPILVTRKLIPNVLELPPGWYSAMGQGQCMSLLVRAYLATKDKKYLESAVNGMNVFEISSEQGGVRTKFANTYDWYEEYPTTPSNYVLNGFIYSLMGLYDLKEVASGKDAETAEKLYDAGMKSLKAMLMFFDTGSGTLYDLRHIMLGIAPNLARWDYHTTHINQLLQLYVITKDSLFQETAKRWTDYMKGIRAPHN